ncbi:hypothetical protein [Halorhabdus salina]|uniref:hypothetical protein n=1 Tax=Halorhabdus salina TaxID=2750670 RepID=UPI0015EEE814|nr:hypothetical protein [Halorhabdus salina]
MTAINPKASARYWARLFGYFLVLAVIGGGFTGGGIYLLDEAEAFPGGPGVDVGTELAAGGVLTAVGVLLVLAGFLTIVLNVVADGVRAGVEAASGPTETVASDAETADEPATDDVETKTFAPGETASAPQAGGDQQHVVSAQARASAEDDEAWKREVEQKLETEGERASGERAAQRPEQTATDDESPPAESQSGGQERPGASEPVTRNAPAEPGRDTDESPAEDQLPDQSAEDERETMTPADSEDTGADEADEWVSAEKVQGEQPTTEPSEQPGGPSDEPAAEELPEEGGDADKPQEPRDASDLFGTDTAETGETDDESSDNPLAPDTIEPQDDTPSDPFADADESAESDDEETNHEPQ